MPADDKQWVNLAGRQGMARRSRVPARMPGGLRRCAPGRLRQNRWLGQNAGSHVSPQLRGHGGYSA
jgi:hypothetical protein